MRSHIRGGFPGGDRGYAMAALLVAMSVMAVLMSALLPVWSHMATREKEEELIFRGKQYARAIGLFQRKFANTAPPTIDVLVEQRFLRKKYKDPITNDDFQPIYANQAAIQPPGGGPSSQRPGQSATSNPPAQQTTLQAGFGSTGGGVQGGVIGVTSKSKDESIKIYNGRSRYNEWAFVYVQTAQRPGQGGGPGGQPGQQQQPGPFGMPQGNRPQGGFPPPQPGFGQPNRPPINQPNRPFGNPNPNGQFTTPNGGTTFTPIPNPRRPGGQ
jgi:type II secretory pathway pseudopilin PulG